MRKITDYEWKQIRVGGRTDGKTPITLFYAGSYVEFNVKAANLTVVLDASFESNEQWIVVLVNGAFIARQMLYKGENLVHIFRNMNPEKVKTIRIIKETECFPDDASAHLLVKNVLTDGEITEAPKKRPLTIEFIGDSITAGEGTMGDKSEDEWIPMFFSGYYNYTRMVAEVMDADYRTVSMGGWGIYCGWDNNIHCNIPSIYKKVAGLLTKTEDKLFGSQDDYNFEKDPADVVVVNLGTNDYSGFNQPAFVDSDGCSYKLELDENGEPNEASARKIVNAGKEFLKTIRYCNPKAKILWCLGMLGNKLEPVILQMIEEFKAETGFTELEYLGLPDTTEETVGSRFHPGLIAHCNAAELIVQKLQEMNL